jgi:acyl-homoserine lactone acylase PvdQ
VPQVTSYRGGRSAPRAAGSRSAICAAILAVVIALTCCGNAVAQVQPYGTNDYGGFHSILPPGNNGLDTDTQLAQFEALKTYPPNTNDQFDMYQNLVWGASTLTDATIPDYFKDATFGVKAANVSSTESPEPGVTIEYDEYGVPHIYGDARPELMFGAGYAAAQTRLFEMDALRHVGRADLAGFAGGSNADQDALQWAVAPYTEQDLNNQISTLDDSGPLGHQVYEDGVNYIDGINAYIAAAHKNPLRMMPGEYVALNMPSGPAPFVPADLVAIASAIAGAEGVGGGTELPWTMLMQDLQQHMGKSAGYQAFLDFHSIDNPATPTSIHGVNFPYATVPSKIIPGSEAIPDPGSVVPSPLQQITGGGSGSSASDSHSTTTSALQIVSEGERFGGMLPTGDSNALLVSARDSASGHPLAVMGPQLGYFSPELIMEEDLHGPGVDAEGGAVPGVSQYVELGHGEDYAWSATSGYEGVISTFAVPLCSPSGGAASIQSNYYELNGKCLAMDALQRSESWKPNLSDSTPAGSQTLTAYRTEIGLVEARATIDGKPVAYVQDRSTYEHELDSAIGFMLFNEPAEMTGPAAFEKAADRIGYAFNWLYADSKHIAYFNAGLLPQRAPHTNPLFPTMAKYPWQGFNPADNTAKYIPIYEHPQVIDQDYITSWNNEEAPGYSGADDLTNHTSVWRSQLLDAGVKADLAHGHKMTLAQLIQVMENAGTVDMRGWADLPYLLKVIGTPANPALRQAVSELKSWLAAGAHRVSPSAGAPYEDSAAIQIMDAWWPLLVKAIYQPVVGTSAWAELQQIDPLDQPPDEQLTSPGGGGEVHMGSAWDVGFYGTVQTDLEDVLGMHPIGALQRKYCGRGSLSACRNELVASLSQAVAEPATQVYPGYTEGSSTCKAGNQWCWDAIVFRALGAISQPMMQWVNRPTFQQADEIQGHRPFPPEPACIYAEYPTVSIRSARVTASGVSVSGVAMPRACGVPSARLRTVQIAVARLGGGGRCQFLGERRRGAGLGAQRRCDAPSWLAARGKRGWTRRVTAALPAGRYRVQVRVTDVSGNTALGRSGGITIRS